MAECIFGIKKPTSGDIYINGQKSDPRHPRDAIRKKVALITEDRKFTGLNLKGTVKENITLVGLQNLAKFGFINNQSEMRVTNKYIRELRIKTNSGNTLMSNLSGGNQQKVVLSKWLLTEPDIIILDEPTRGIDVGTKRDVYVLVGDLVKAGKAVLMISSEIPELIGLSDRIIVLAEGRLTGELKRSEFTQEAIMKYAATFQ
jgi:ABC-type sugar transport system ATPase subunit